MVPLNWSLRTLLMVASLVPICSFSVHWHSAVKSTSKTNTATFTKRDTALFALETETDDMYFAVSEDTETSLPQSTRTSRNKQERQERVLGSQELLMLPRQYAPNDKVVFPQMNHVSCTVLSATPDVATLERAIDEAIASHPLLRARVEGDGEPNERIDLFQMVRKGEPNPCTFVVDEQQQTISSKDVLTVVTVDGNGRDALESSWKASFARDLDDGSWCNVETGPMWKVELHQLKGDKNEPCALMFSFNHAVSDQSSANMLVDQIIANVASIEESNKIVKEAVKHDMPIALEDSVLGNGRRFSDIQAGGFTPGTARYVADKAAEGFKNPVILPDSDTKEDGGGILGALTIISGKASGGEDEKSQERKSTLQFRKLSRKATAALLAQCRERGVSITNALSAAVTLTATDFVDNGVEKGEARNYKVLQSLDMRRFGDQLDKCDTVACMAGSMDLLHGPLPDKSGQSLRENHSAENLYRFWKLALEGKEQTAAFVESDGPRHAVRVFDFAMSISDMNNLIHLTAQSKDSQGRAYSAGISNVGVYDRQKAVRREDDSDRDLLKITHGRYKVEEVFFATSHARTGCLYQVSCLTVDGEMQCTFHPASPVVSEETNAEFADAFMDILETVAGMKGEPKPDESGFDNPLSKLPKNALSTATAVCGAFAVARHAGAYQQFFQSLTQMRDNVQDPEQFWAALNFWIFFAVGHPLLQPILWISDVLHGSPGPMIANLVPITFIAGNVLAIAAFTSSKEIQKVVNIAALAAFFTYVGAGLDGQAGLGDYNLALDDSYKGQVVKGCPAYDQVRQPSMDNFDLNKYQGLWYEHKFHDWTQFKEVYDTTLDIKLTPDGKGWIDDFGVKGPAPDAAPLSWDKSPVANGAHYFLFGRVDPKDPPGVLRESGFGVEFPNYIVDVQKDPSTGEYKEAIQFQCLERGGVRVFEGINFMSRNPEMSESELSAMHARAEKAGMYPYGASPEQMHTVARRPQGAPPIDNSWQAMWRAIGFDKLLELLTESIEDGGR